jgi:hypothetical protein
MTSRKFSAFVRLIPFALFSIAALSPALHAQALLASAPLPDSPTPFVAAASPVVIAPSSGSAEKHRFWDRQNRILFVAAAVSNGADFAVTRANLQNGGQELNPLVRVFGRSTAGLAANFVGETAGVVSLSYFFHKTGHHKLERAVSMVNIAGSASAVSFGLAHR